MKQWLADLLKGGRRYRRVRSEVIAHSPGAEVTSFFIGVDRNLSLFAAFRPGNWQRDEYAVALTNEHVTAFELSKPSLVSSRIVGVAQRVEARSVDWSSDRIVIGDLFLYPFPFHRKDALELSQAHRRA